MRHLRSTLRLIFALEGAVFLTAAFYILRHANAITSSHRYNLGRHSIFAIFWGVLLIGVVSGLAAWRITHSGVLGRWSVLAASILNLAAFPVGTIVAAAGIFYFVRSPQTGPALHREHQPVAGDGTSKVTSVIFTIGQFAWAIFVLGAIHRWTIARGMPQIHSEGIFWITLACAVYGSILFHEMGHFILGDIVRFRLIGFGVGPLTWAHAKGRWRVHIRYERLFGGFTAMVPTAARHIRIRSMALTLGGPLASALLGALGAICLILIPGPDWPAAVGRTVALATGFAFGDFLFNLMPFASGAQYSDGARLWQMYRRGPWSDFHYANHFMGLSHATPFRPRDWPSDMVERAAEFAAKLPDPAGSFTRAYVHFLDRGDWEKALSWLDRAREAAPPGSKLTYALTIDRAFLEAFRRHDGPQAQRLFDQAPPQEDSTDYWRALASVRAIQGDLPGASAAWKKGWDMAQTRPATGIYDMDRDQLRMVGAWLDQLHAQPISA